MENTHPFANRPACRAEILIAYPGEPYPMVHTTHHSEDARAALAWAKGQLAEMLPQLLEDEPHRKDEEFPHLGAVVDTPWGEIHLVARFDDDKNEVLVAATPAAQCCGPLATWDPAPITRMTLTLRNRDEVAAWIGDAAHLPADPGSDVLLVKHGGTKVVIKPGMTVERTAHGLIRRLAADEL